MERRRKLARTMFVLDVLVCGTWTYLAASDPIRIYSGTGPESGGIAGISIGILNLAFTVAPPIITIALTRASGSTRVARYWRNAHLAATLALVMAGMIGSLRVLIVSIAVFVPVQVFFVVGAVAIWIPSVRPRNPRDLGDGPR